MHKTPSYMLRACSRIVIVAALALPGVAAATMIDFTGTPTFAGLTTPAGTANAASQLSGTLTLSTIGSDGSFGLSDVDAFDLSFGNLVFDAGALPANATLSGSLSSDGTRLTSLFYQFTVPSSNATCAGCSLNLAMGVTPGGFSATYNTLQDGSGVIVGTFDTSLSTPSTGDHDIPEPSALAMFGLGVVLTGWGVRRRRTS